MRLTHFKAVAVMVLCSFLWSTAGVVTKQLDATSGFEVTFWRSFFTVVALALMLPITHGRRWYKNVPWSNKVLWVSGACWSVMFTAFMIAMVLTTVANVLITLAVAPLLTALVSRIVTGYKLPLRTYVAIGMAGFGIGYMFWSQFAVGQPSDIAGCLIALLVPLCGSIMWTNAQRLQISTAFTSKNSGKKEPTIDLIPCVFIGAVISSVTTLPFALPFQASLHDVSWLAFLGVFQLAIPCTLAVVAGRVLKAAEAALLALLEVVFGITWAWLFVGENPSPQVLTGGLLVLAALLGNVLLGLKDHKPISQRSSAD
jgi:drug/metabolite transporter (DMT)-like permease